jgi:hypothetical protein
MHVKVSEHLKLQNVTSTTDSSVAVIVDLTLIKLAHAVKVQRDPQQRDREIITKSFGRIVKDQRSQTRRIIEAS